eukprot:12242480-Prorocentrum_lima.AAC.1
MDNVMSHVCNVHHVTVSIVNMEMFLTWTTQCDVHVIHTSGMPLRRPWTEIDMQEALLLRVRGTKLRELVNDRRNRGLERLPERTIRRRLQAVLEAVDNHIGANDS